MNWKLSTRPSQVLLIVFLPNFTQIIKNSKLISSMKKILYIYNHTSSVFYLNLKCNFIA